MQEVPNGIEKGVQEEEDNTKLVSLDKLKQDDEIGIKFQKTNYKNKQRPKKKNAKLNFNENQFQMFEEQFKIKLLSKK